ncbi:MAG: hypothetical protein WCC41_01875, partial [Rhodomicrobium sp.]
MELRSLLENVEPSEEMPRALSVLISAASSVDAIVREVVAYLAETARRLWPVWYYGSGVAFDICGNDSLGRQAACVLAGNAAKKVSGVLPFWAEQAAILALSGCAPRISGLSPSAEMIQLTKAIAPNGLALIVSRPSNETKASAEAFVRALEWISKT